ncbi:thioredoxin reductase 1, cytoplasmic-like [Bacillus rossius redtenbacheri]|uniref:thioredoxin reductase 1, cytoplasmic-like n=1 Tax=Bacillus rossius redtenbacheri TaxID=93214 RepID=UPI002FDEC387
MFRKIVDKFINDNGIFIFSKSYCPYCKKVKDLFSELAVQFGSVELDQIENGNEIQAALYEKSKQKTVPNVYISGRHMGGCSDVVEAQASGLLQDLLDALRIGQKYEYDLVVLGGGSGGLAAAQEAAAFGRKVAVCDFVVPAPSPFRTVWGLGGTCVNVGCIPKKLMHNAALLHSELAAEAPYFGFKNHQQVSHGWTEMIENVQRYIGTLNTAYETSLEKKKIDYINAFAEFVDPHKLKLTDAENLSREITSKKFIISVGCRPRYPDIPGAKEFCITSDDLFSLKTHPGKTLIIGASYIALECAGFLAELGIDCTVMVRSIFLRGFDQQMANMVADTLSACHVKFIQDTVPVKIEKSIDNSLCLKVTGIKGADQSSIELYVDTVIFAIGRDACTKSLGLGNADVKINEKNGKIIVDEAEQTSAPDIFAIGDVADGKPELTPVAIKAGRLLMQRLCGRTKELMDYTNIPTTVFTPLEYGCIGLAEEDAVAKFGQDNIEVYHSNFQPLEFSLSKKLLNKSYAKLICVKNENERVVGIHYLGPNAGEIIQGYGIGIKMGAKKSDFDSLVGIHPTSTEVFTTMNITKSSGVSSTKTEC